MTAVMTAMSIRKFLKLMGQWFFGDTRAVNLSTAGDVWCLVYLAR